MVVSFHTVPAEELIEERPHLAGETGNRQMRYIAAAAERKKQETQKEAK